MDVAVLAVAKADVVAVVLAGVADVVDVVVVVTRPPGASRATAATVASTVIAKLTVAAAFVKTATGGAAQTVDAAPTGDVAVVLLQHKLVRFLC